MATPDRPVAHGSIESVWGQAIHDAVFAPAGCLVHGSAITLASDHSTSKLNLDTVDHDPGGFCVTGSDQIEIPTDRAGIYHLSFRGTQTSGQDPDQIRVKVFINGSVYTFWEFPLESGGGQTQFAQSLDLPDLDAGDIISMHANKVGSSGPNPQVGITHFSLRRVGSEYGA